MRCPAPRLQLLSTSSESACSAPETPAKKKTCFRFIRHPSRRKAEIGETDFRRIVVRPMHVLGTYRPFDTLPHAFFDAMALMVAASLLLAIAAAARTIWLRARPAGAAKAGVGH